jgi:hypothetical protein
MRLDGLLSGPLGFSLLRVGRESSSINSEAGDRKKQKHYQAWQVINTAQGKGGSGRLRVSKTPI